MTRKSRRHLQLQVNLLLQEMSLIFQRLLNDKGRDSFQRRTQTGCEIFNFLVKTKNRKLKFNLYFCQALFSKRPFNLGEFTYTQYRNSMSEYSEYKLA